MLNFKNHMLLNRKENIERKNLAGKLVGYKNERVASIFTSDDTSITKMFKISVASTGDINLDLNYQDIIIEAFDNDSLAHLKNGEMRFFINSDHPLYESICSFLAVRINKEHTNSLTDITLSRTLFVDGTVSLTISGINLKSGQILKIEVGPNDLASLFDYYRLIDLYKSFEKIVEEKKGILKRVK